MATKIWLFIAHVCNVYLGVMAYMPRACVTMTSSRLPEATQSDARLEGHVFLRLEVAGSYWCARRCLQQHKCKSFNYHPNTDVCQLNDVSREGHVQDMVDAPGIVYYDRDVIPEYFLGACEGHTCHPDAVCQPQDAANYTCDCQNPNLGGNNCSISVLEDPCINNPCGEGGTCFETPDGFQCACPPGYTGELCAHAVCPGYRNASVIPNGESSRIEVTWNNDADGPVDIFFVLRDDQERYAFSVPAAAERLWPAHVDTLWVARDQERHALLLVDSGCSYIVPPAQTYGHPVRPSITGN